MSGRSHGRRSCENKSYHCGHLRKVHIFPVHSFCFSAIGSGRPKTPLHLFGSWRFKVPRTHSISGQNCWTESSQHWPLSMLQLCLPGVMPWASSPFPERTATLGPCPHISVPLQVLSTDTSLECPNINLDILAPQPQLPPIHTLPSDNHLFSDK